MDLEEILALKNAHVRSKEAEARRIITEWAGPASDTLERLKREFGGFLNIQEMGRLISPTEEVNYRLGKTQATRFLFDAYAETVFDTVPEPEKFIALLGPIRERVRLTLSVIDKHEAELRQLDWERRAWQRQQSVVDRAVSALAPGWVTGIRRAWNRVRALWSPNPVFANAATAVHAPAGAGAIHPTLSGAASDPEVPPAGGALITPVDSIETSGPGTAKSAMVDDFLLRCNKEPELTERLYKKHIWGAVGHTTPRQFQYWQAGDAAATAEDEKNFGRILAMSPVEFIVLLKKMRLISEKS